LKLFLYNPLRSVREFHQRFRVKSYVELESDEQRFAFKAQRCDLILEETIEAIQAIREGSREEVAKELADVLYVVYGTADLLDIPLATVFEEVHLSNMSKLGKDGEPVYREDGKVMKPPGWTPPSIAPILAG
jgi:predicted HAD superfamily Cof-like phosphohydrolase